MAEPYIGQVRIFSFDFPPSGWALCHGGLLPISQNTSIFALLKTQFGGDGRTSVGLPDMRGRVPVHTGTVTYNNYGDESITQTITQGEKEGTETKTLTLEDMGPHTHSFRVVDKAATSREPANLAPAQPAERPIYGLPNTLLAMAPEAIGGACEGQPMNNVQRSLVLNFCICLNGVFPSRGDA